MELRQILKLPTDQIAKLEGDSTDLSMVYGTFMAIHMFYEQDDFTTSFVSKDDLVKIILSRWNYIHTESMGFAYLLNPRFSGLPMAGTDKLDTIMQLEEYIEKFYLARKNIMIKSKEITSEDANTTISNSIRKCKEQLHLYLGQWSTMSAERKKKLDDYTPLGYWTTLGSDFPELSLIAIRLFFIPTSSAAAERVWSVFSFIHTNRQNLLKNIRVEKLAFIYVNWAIWDKNCPRDILTAFEEDSDGDSE